MISDAPVDFTAPSGPTCLDILSPYTAAWHRGYSYDIEPDDSEEGQGQLTVFAQESAVAVSAEQAQVTTSTYGACYATQSEGDVNGAPVTGPVTTTDETINAGVPSFMRLYTFPYTELGKTKTNYDSVIWLAYGRFRAILDLWTCCALPPVSDFTADAQLLGTRMQAATTGGGTTVDRQVTAGRRPPTGGTAVAS
jgi:hypothetical protein